MTIRNGAILTGKPFVFQGAIDAHTAHTFSEIITASGHIETINIKFAAGENGTLKVRPMVIQNGQIPIDLIKYANGLNQYVSGDDESFTFKCYMPVENGTELRIIVDNTGDYTSFLDVAVIIEFADYIAEYSVIKGA